VTQGATKRGRIALTVATVAAALMVFVSQSIAQAEPKSLTILKVVPAPAHDSNARLRIAAEKLDVRDKSRIATFSGGVHLDLDETRLRSDTLIVIYEDNGQVRCVDARGSVSVTRNDQHATADRAEFDMRANMVRLTGNAVLTKGASVMRGQRMLFDTTISEVTVESGLLHRFSPEDGGCS